MRGWSRRRSALGRQYSTERLVLPALFILTIMISFACAISLQIPFFHAAAPSEESLPPALDSVPEPSAPPSSSSLKASITLLTVLPGEEATYRYDIANEGETLLRRVRILDGGGHLLGILPRLDPGESRSLVHTSSSSDPSSKSLEVAALDSQDKEVTVQAKTVSSRMNVRGSGGFDGEEPLTSSPAPTPVSEGSDAILRIASVPEEPIPSTPQMATGPSEVPGNTTLVEGKAASDETTLPEGPSPLNLTIQANRTEGYAGEVIEWRCVLKNLGPGVINDIEMTCLGKKTTTKFLSVGKEFTLEGVLKINSTTDIECNAGARDSLGRLWNESSALRIWEISPRLRVLAEASSRQVHRGETVSLTATVENLGQEEITGIRVWDGLGEVGWISSLGPGESTTLRRDLPLYQSIEDKVCAEAKDGPEEIYASTSLDLHVLRSELNLTVNPKEGVIYAGEPLEVTWTLANTGEEILRNVSFGGDGLGKGRLKELAPGTSVRMAGRILANNSTDTLLRAWGYGSEERVSDQALVKVQVISPGISLQVTPSEVEACAGEMMNLTFLIANIGNDLLRDVTLSEKTLGVLARLEEIKPKDFQVVNSQIIISGNQTMEFQASGLDSRSQTCSASFAVPARLVISGLDLVVSANPDEVKFGDRSQIVCKVRNRGSTPLYNIFVMGKQFGPLGTIDYLPPRESKTVIVEKLVTTDIDETITAEGFTSAKVPVLDKKGLRIKILKAQDTGSAISRGMPKLHLQGVAQPTGNVTEYWDQNVSNPSKNHSEAVGSLGVTTNGDDRLNSSFYSPTPKGITNSSISSDLHPESPDNGYMQGISRLLNFIQMLFAGRGSEPSGQASNLSSQIELEVQSVQTGPQILDILASPPEPRAGSPVKVSVHVQGQGVKGVILRWGQAEPGLTKDNLDGVPLTRSIPMTREAGTDQDGYWSCLVPGQSAGTCVSMVVSATDGQGTSDDGPYPISWVSRDLAQSPPPAPAPRSSPAKLSWGGLGDNISAHSQDMLFIESSTVTGRGEVSIRDSFSETSMGYEEHLKGFGSIVLESERAISKGNPVVNFSQNRDLVFGDGTLKGFKRMESPGFHGGMGASITERFNISQLDKSEMGMIRTVNHTKNTLAFATEQAFNGTWNTKTQYARFNKKMKEDQEFKGSFETQKSIKFQD